MVRERGVGLMIMLLVNPLIILLLQNSKLLSLAGDDSDKKQLSRGIASIESPRVAEIESLSEEKSAINSCRFVRKICAE